MSTKVFGPDDRRQYRKTWKQTTTNTVHSWQIWRADPRDIPVLIDGESAPREATWAKYHPDGATPQERFDARSGVVVSARAVHAWSRAWLCPTWPRKNVAVEVPIVVAGSERAAYLALTCSVSTEVLKLDRDLLALMDTLHPLYRAAFVSFFAKLLAGDWSAGGATAGDIVQHRSMPELSGIVLTSCKLEPHKRDVLLIWQQTLQLDAYRTIFGPSDVRGPQFVAEVGLLVLADSSACDLSPDKLPVGFSLRTLRPVLVEDMIVVGHAYGATSLLRQATLEAFAKP